MGGTTFRVASRPKRTTIDRRPINDSTLSFRARGVLVWLLDKPDGWRVRASEIARQSDKEGRDAVGTALNELRAKGYIVTTKYRADNGQWATDNCVYEIPVAEADRDGKPGTGFPVPGFPSPGSQGLTPESTETDDWVQPPNPQPPTDAEPRPNAVPPVPTPESLRLSFAEATTTPKEHHE